MIELLIYILSYIHKWLTNLGGNIVTKASEIAEGWRDNAKTKELSLVDGNELSIYMLEKRDWADINKKTGFDIWSKLLDVFDIFSGMSQQEIEKLPDEEKQKRRREAGMKFFRELGPELQLEMFKQSLQKDDPEVTTEDVSRILTHMVDEDVEEMEYLQFMLSGVQQEDIEEEAESASEVDSKK